MNNFEFISGNGKLLDFVQPLWEKSNKHHENNSNYWYEFNTRDILYNSTSTQYN